MALHRSCTMQVVLCVVAAMFVGRLGPLTLVFVLAQKSQREYLEYPSETVRVG